MRSLLVVIASIATLGASTTSDERAAFVGLARNAGASHDLNAFRALYCDPGKLKLSLIANVLPLFSRADISLPVRSNPGVEFTLLMCFESPVSKEMCQVFQVTRREKRLCILDDTTKSRA
jgi:hypothetical protein